MSDTDDELFGRYEPEPPLTGKEWLAEQERQRVQAAREQARNTTAEEMLDVAALSRRLWRPVDPRPDLEPLDLQLLLMHRNRAGHFLTSSPKQEALGERVGVTRSAVRDSIGRLREAHLLVELPADSGDRRLRRRFLWVTGEEDRIVDELIARGQRQLPAFHQRGQQP